MESMGRFQPAVGILALGLAVLSLGGCDPRKTDPIRSGWSRGLPLATARLGDPPSLAVTSTARWLVWGDVVEGEPKLILGRVDPTGVPFAPIALVLPFDYPHAPQLLVTGDELILFFLARVAPKRDRLIAQRIGKSGALNGSPVFVSPEGQDIEAYDVIDTARGCLVAWGEKDSGVWLQALADDLAPDGPAIRAAEAGGSPTLAVDRAGGAHLVWVVAPALGRRELLYAQVSPDLSSVAGPWALGVATGGLGAVFSSPVMALDESRVYALLSVEYRGGLRAGTTETYVFAAERDSPDAPRASTLTLPDLVPETYGCCLEGLPFDPLHARSARNVNVRVLSGHPLEGDHAVVLASAKLSVGRKTELQPVAVFLKEGTVSGWSPIAATMDLSLSGEIVPSPVGWHAVWLDMRASGEYRVLYATTSAAEGKVLNRFEASDFVHVVLTVLSGLVAGLAAIPLFFLAGIPGLLVVVGHYVLGGEGDLSVWQGKLLLGIGVGAYGVLELMFTGGLVPKFPFAEWLSPPLARSLVLAVPLGSLVAALGAVLLYWRKADQPGLLPAYALFIGVDVVFSLFLVGPSLAGA